MLFIFYTGYDDLGDDSQIQDFVKILDDKARKQEKDVAECKVSWPWDLRFLLMPLIKFLDKFDKFSSFKFEIGTVWTYHPLTDALSPFQLWF